VADRYAEALRLDDTALQVERAAARIQHAGARLATEVGTAGGPEGAVPNGGPGAAERGAVDALRGELVALAQRVEALNELPADPVVRPDLERLVATLAAVARAAAEPVPRSGALPAAARQGVAALDQEIAAFTRVLRVRTDALVEQAREGSAAVRRSTLGMAWFTPVAVVIMGWLAWRTHAAHRALIGHLGRLVHEDGLTGVTNRRGLDEQLPLETARARRLKVPLTAVMLDLDHFKRYNDRRGHAAGDELLRNAAQSWRRQLRPTDIVARYGGEEFTLVLPSCDGAQALQLIDRLRPLMPEQQTFSAGVATWDGHESEHDLLVRADRALLQAKKAGRDRTVVAAVEPQMTLPLRAA
jgi:diguanylate cyclase (GGDEF)-like protein